MQYNNLDSLKQDQSFLKYKNYAMDNQKTMPCDEIQNLRLSDLNFEDVDEKIISNTCFIVKYMFDLEEDKQLKVDQAENSFYPQSQGQKKANQVSQSNDAQSLKQKIGLAQNFQKSKSKGQQIANSIKQNKKTKAQQEKEPIAVKIAEYDIKLIQDKQQRHLNLKMNLSKLVVGAKQINIQNIGRIKIGPIKKKRNQKGKQNFIIIEANKVQGRFDLIFNQERLVQHFPLPFYVFSRLVQRRLKLTDRYLEIPWEKCSHIEKRVILNSYIYGKIYKKSQFLGKWEQRYIVINDEGLFSYQNHLKQQRPSFFIKRQSIKSIQTKFEIIQYNLVVCIRYGIHQTYFGIPVADITHRNGKNWLFQLYRMII